MATARFAWGIDVGNRALKAIKLVRNGDQYRIDDFEVIEHEQVLSNAGDNREALVQTALASFVQRHPMKGGVVSIGVSGQSSFARFIKLPPVEPKKIPEIVRFEAIQQVPFPLDDVEWSYQLFQSESSPDVEVGIFAMRKELVNQHIRYFSDAEMNVQVVQMSPLAVYNAMHYDNRLDGTTLIVDLGAENCDLIIADRDSVWLRSIPVGGNSFTEALVKSFKLSFAKAEDLKRNAATSKYARQIFQAMRPVFADLVAEIQRSIGFYASVHRDSRIQRVVALGGTFRLPGLLKYLQQNLQLDVERLNGLGAGAPADAKLATAFNDNLLSMVTAYGLALQAMGEGKITSSLLPQHIRRAKLWQGKTWWFGMAAAMVVAGTSVPYLSIYMHTLALDRAAADAQPAINEVKGRADNLSRQWAEIQGAGGSDRQRIDALRSLQGYRNLWISLLKDIHSALPQHNPATPPTERARFSQASLPRAERKLILIDSIRTQYYADINPYLGDVAFFQETGAQDPFSLPSMTSFDVFGLPRYGPVPVAAAPRRGGGGGGPGSGFVPPTGPPPDWKPPGRPSSPVGPPEGWRPPGMPEGAAFGPVAPAADAAAEPEVVGPPQKGFLLTIRCTTPNGGGEAFVNQTLVKALRALTPATASPQRPYAVVKAGIAYGQPLREDDARKQIARDAYQARQDARKAIGVEDLEELDAIPGRPRRPGRPSDDSAPRTTGFVGLPPDVAARINAAAGQAAQANVAQGGWQQETSKPKDTTPAEIYLDPATNEDMRDDWSFTIVAAVAVDPVKPDAAPPAAGK